MDQMQEQSWKIEQLTRNHARYAAKRAEARKEMKLKEEWRERRRKAAAAAAAEAEEKRRAAEMTEVEAEQHGDDKEAVQPAATEGAIDTTETVLPFAQEPIGEKAAAQADQHRQSEQAERRMKDEVAEADRQMEEKVNISAARRLASLIARKLPLRQNLALAACWLCFVLPTIY